MADSNSGFDDELVSQFLAFTGSADASSATSYLEMSGGNLETAVSLFMEHGAGGAGGASTGGGLAGGGFEEVRAPDQTRTMRLMDDHAMHQDPSFQLMRDLMDQELQNSAFAPRPAQDVRAAVNAAAAAARSGDGESKDSDEMDTDDDDDVQVIAPNVAGLSDMFAAPEHLMHKGAFQTARTMAKDAKRWLLVNIQRDSEFACHALNRDVWRDELVENLIREGFIFWQQMDITPEGRTYTERYQVMDYPHVAIIDPRTARLMWRKEGWTQQNPLTAATFAEYAMDFCSKNTFDKPPQAPRPAGATGVLPSKRPVHHMSEEEQMMDAAMKASLEDTKTEIDDSDSVEIVEGNVPEKDSKPMAEEKPKSINDELLAMDIGDEPAKGARIQFRMPDGKRIVRKFSGGDKVKVIYAFVAQKNEEARAGKEFMLLAGYPPADLLDKIETETVDGCKLSGQAVTVRWKS